MRTIYLSNHKAVGQGAYSSYFKLNSKRGIKVYGMGSYDWNSYEFKKDIDFSTVKSDFKLIRSLRTRLVPKAYEIVAVYSKGEWFPAIIMQHCVGITLEKAVRGYKADNMLHDIAEEFQKKTEYRHEDLHSNNVIYNKKTKKYKVIDICVDWMFYTGKKAA